jgi:YfiH family protein
MVDLVKILEWERYPWLRHGFSTRSGGVSTIYGGKSLNLGWTKDDDPALVAENRRLLVEAVTGGDGGQRAVTVRQIHSTITHAVTEESGSFETPEGRALVEGDGLMTNLPGVLLGIQTADCVPVMVVDPERRAVSVFHAGWRGTVAGIVQQGVARMAEEYGSRPSDLLAAVGPSIGSCCYAIGGEVRARFGESFPYAEQLFREADGRQYLDLWEANRRQLLAAGVLDEQISVVGECTGCAVDADGARRYFSHRVDDGFTGRMMSCIGVA